MWQFFSITSLTSFALENRAIGHTLSVFSMIQKIVSGDQAGRRSNGAGLGDMARHSAWRLGPHRALANGSQSNKEQTDPKRKTSDTSPTCVKPRIISDNGPQFTARDFKESRISSLFSCLLVNLSLGQLYLLREDK
jgi:hypothetical protein